MVRNFKTVFILFVMQYLLLTAVHAASVRATVDTVEVVKGNAVTLRIKAVGGNVVFPDISMIANSPVRGTSTSSSQNWSLINGTMKNESSTTRSLQFIPTQNMTIPSYTVEISGKAYKTDPIGIKVVKSNVPKGKKGGLFSLEMKTGKAKICVGESVMLTVYFALRNDVRLSQEVQYTQPEFSDFIVLDGDEQQAYMKGNYQIQEVRYIITGHREGNFTISPAQVKVGVPDGGRRDFFGMAFGTKWYHTASNSIEVEVLPQTQLSDLIGEFTLDSTVDSKEVKANKPVNLTVTIEGKGSLENLEYPDYEIDGVTVYSDEAKVETKVVGGELYSTYSKSFAFIADEDFNIPKQHFSVLDPKSDTLKQLTVQGYKIQVKNTAKNTTVTTTMPHQNVVQTNIPQSTPVKEVIVQKRVEVKSVAWWMLVIAFSLGALMTYLLRFIPKRKTNVYKEYEALKILYGHMGEDDAVEEMVRKLYARKNGDKSVTIDKNELKEMVERFM